MNVAIPKNSFGENNSVKLTKMGEDLVGAVTDGDILVWGGFNGNTEPMNLLYMVKIKVNIQYYVHLGSAFYFCIDIEYERFRYKQFHLVFLNYF